jgi:hypothetical protein
MLRSERPATLPPRGRSLPTLPNRRSEYLSIHSDCCFGLTSRCSALVGVSTCRIPRDPVGVRSLDTWTRWKSRKPAWTSGATGVLPPRQRPSMLIAKHRRPGEAGHGRDKPKLPPSDHRLLLAAPTTNRRHQPELCYCRLDTAEHHMDSVAVTLPPPFRRELRSLALEIRRAPTYTPCSGFGIAEIPRIAALFGDLLRQNRRKLLRIAALDKQSPDEDRPPHRRRKHRLGASRRRTRDERERPRR